MKRPERRFPEAQIQKAILEFTTSPRHWSAFSADKIETIMKHYHAIPWEGWYYHQYDAATGEFVFQGPAIENVPMLVLKQRIPEDSIPKLPPGELQELEESTKKDVILSDDEFRKWMHNHLSRTPSNPRQG